MMKIDVSDVRFFEHVGSYYTLTKEFKEQLKEFNLDHLVITNNHDHSGFYIELTNTHVRQLTLEDKLIEVVVTSTTKIKYLFANTIDFKTNKSNAVTYVISDRSILYGDNGKYCTYLTTCFANQDFIIHQDKLYSVDHDFYIEDKNVIEITSDERLTVIQGYMKYMMPRLI